MSAISGDESRAVPAEVAPPAPKRHPIRDTVETEFGIGPLVREYLVPVETNTIWYILGGVLGMAIALEYATGMLLALRYLPDAGRAYTYTYDMIHSRPWHVIIGFHYFNAFLIFGLVMVHMLRVFVSAAYRRGKQGLWLVGVLLAGLLLGLVVTGESLHWDEVGFAVPWHASEVLQAFHIENTFHYTFADLKDIPRATGKLIQIYALHVAILPILLILAIMMHYYLIKVKRISLPFWIKPSGRTTPFSVHIREWLVYGGVILGIVFLLGVFVPRGAGTPPQLLPDSPLFGATHGPGGLGYKPSFPISWTHGMNVFFGEHLGIEPDIWGSIVGTILMTGALVAIPFVDPGETEPVSWREAFDWRRRGWAFAAMGIFWLVMIVGVIQNAIAGPG
jgi:quinol-cytochrome oxidoreductase complex cytochrome b subunit